MRSWQLRRVFTAGEVAEAFSALRQNTYWSIVNWEGIEQLWRSCFDRYLCIDPEEVAVVLAEPPMTSPRDREIIAELFFEGYGVRKLYLGAPSLLTLRSCCCSGDIDMQMTTTALVVESGAGVTRVTPVVNGYVLTTSTQQMMIGGEDITGYVLQSLREHEQFPSEEDCLMHVAETVKERHTYTAKDIVKEMALFDSNLPNFVIRHNALHHRTQELYNIDVGYERFLAAEVMFRPELLTSGTVGTTSRSLPDCIDAAVWSCPIDCRRPLYANILLSGGNTLFPKMAKRLSSELQHILNCRAQSYMEASDSTLRRIEYVVNVAPHPLQRNAVWCGGSIVGASDDFDMASKSRQAYLEYGASIFH